MARVLVVDDDPATRVMVEIMLGAEGHQVVQAADGWQAMRIIKDQSPDLILMDVIMPGLSGYDVAGRIKDGSDGPQIDTEVDTLGIAVIPIIFVSANCDPEDMADTWDLAVDYIHKPFAEPELVTRVRRVLELRELEKKLGELRPGRESQSENWET